MSHRRHPICTPLLAVVGSLLSAAVLYAVLMSWRQVATGYRHDIGQLALARGIELLILAWCLWVGTSIGSFLNVVAWRMPRGIGINGRSICPRCHTRLRARDNLPVFGYLARRGRCRACRLPISPRYPMVEAIVGCSITAVAAGELFGVSLPYVDLLRQGVPRWNFSFSWPTMLIMTYHVVAVAVAWSLGLVLIDGHRLPKQLFRFAIASTLIPMLVWPTLMIVPWQVDVAPTWRPAGLYADAMIRVITAIVAAVFFARSLALSLCPSADPKLDPLSRDTTKLLELTVVLLVPIVVVGWQASPAVIVTAALLAIASRRILLGADALGRLAIAVPVALTCQLALWRPLHQAWWWPSAGTDSWVFLAWVVAAMLIPLWLSAESAERAADPPR